MVKLVNFTTFPLFRSLLPVHRPFRVFSPKNETSAGGVNPYNGRNNGQNSRNSGQNCHILATISTVLCTVLGQNYSSGFCLNIQEVQFGKIPKVFYSVPLRSLVKTGIQRSKWSKTRPVFDHFDEMTENTPFSVISVKMSPFSPNNP